MYYIIEIQEPQDGPVGIITYTKETKKTAMSKYHEILMYAELGSLKRHTAVVMEGNGQYIARDCVENYFNEGE